MEDVIETLKVFEFGSWQATTRVGKSSTTMKSVDRVKDDEVHAFVRCRLVARDVKLRHEGSRRHSVRPSPECAEPEENRGKLMFVDVKNNPSECPMRRRRCEGGSV